MNSFVMFYGHLWVLHFSSNCVALHKNLFLCFIVSEIFAFIQANGKSDGASSTWLVILIRNICKKKGY